MPKRQSIIEKLIAELCPEGVEFKELGAMVKILRGKRLTKNQLSDGEKYPVYHGGLEPLGLYSQSNRIANTVMVINVGASAGTVGYSAVDFWSSDGCFCVGLSDLLISRYAYYALLCQENILRSKVRFAGIPTLDASAVEGIKIPIPPLPIQQEIVKILDTFTTLEAELEAELEARKKQYEYFRNQLLMPIMVNGKWLMNGEEVEWKALGEVCENIVSGKNNIRIENGQYPVYGSTGIIGYSNSYSFNDEYLLVARVGANAGFVHKAKGKYDVSDNTLIIKPKPGYSLSFAYFQLLNLDLNNIAVGGGQPLITASQLKKYKIPIPPLAEQHRIVAILDKFDALVNDISVGLPAELNARRKQYEYYRNKLLSFKQRMING